MKKILPLLLLFAMLLIPATASAQSYDGDTLEDGIVFIPADPGPNSVVNIAFTDLEPLSDITITLIGEDQQEIDGLEVAGALVLRADAAGNFNDNIRLPSNVEAGTLTLRIEATRANGSALVNDVIIEVSADAVTNPGGTDVQPSDLAYTGSEPSTKVFGGLFLVAAGVALVFVATQRRSTASDA